MIHSAELAFALSLSGFVIAIGAALDLFRKDSLIVDVYGHAIVKSEAWDRPLKGLTSIFASLLGERILSFRSIATVSLLSALINGLVLSLIESDVSLVRPTLFGSGSEIVHSSELFSSLFQEKITAQILFGVLHDNLSVMATRAIVRVARRPAMILFDIFVAILLYVSMAALLISVANAAIFEEAPGLVFVVPPSTVSSFSYYEAVGGYSDRLVYVLESITDFKSHFPEPGQVVAAEPLLIYSSELLAAASTLTPT